MSKVNNIYNSISVDTFKIAAMRAFKNHGSKSEVVKFKLDFDTKCTELYNCFIDGTYIKLLKYRQTQRINNNGKVRNIDGPNLITRTYQHLFLELIEPIYYARDNGNGMNCKNGYGITSNSSKKSVIHQLKHLFYDRTDLTYAVVIDQRACYAHITIPIFRKSLKRLTDDKQFIDFAVRVCFVNNHLPIGTPTSPMVHHIIMLDFDRFVKEISGMSVRYADDNLLAVSRKEDAQQLKWRIKNFWWYNLKMRAKKHTARVIPLSTSLDFCGYVFYRNHKNICEHNKGYVKVRKGTVHRARMCKTDESWASYYGLMRHADAYSLMCSIEEKMKLRQLTRNIRIDRKMDAKNIDIRNLIGQVFTIYDYDLRYGADKKPNWIKFLIGVKETSNEKGTSKELAYEFHGNYQGLIEFILECQLEYGKEKLLPIEEVEIENQCGYIFKNSTNQLIYIE